MSRAAKAKPDARAWCAERGLELTIGTYSPWRIEGRGITWLWYIARGKLLLHVGDHEYRCIIELDTWEQTAALIVEFLDAIGAGKEVAG